MSSSITWSVVPTKPERLGGAGHPLKGHVLRAIELEVGWPQQASDLVTTPYAMHRGGRGAAYLQGVHDGTVDDRDQAVRDELSAFLADLDRLGELLIGVEP